MKKVIKSIRSFLKKPFSDQRGSAALEFAMLAPIFTTITLGSVEMINLHRATSQAVTAVNAQADLVSRVNAMDDTQRDIVYAAAIAILDDFGSQAPVGLRITSLQRENNGDFTVLWSVAKNMTQEPDGSTYMPPAEQQLFVRNNETIILSELTFKYTPPIARAVGNFQRSYHYYAVRSPRFVPRIPYPPQDP